MVKIQKMFEMLVGKDRKLSVQKWNLGWRSLLQFETTRKIVESENFDYALFEPFPDELTSAICAGYFNFEWVDKDGKCHKTKIEGDGTITSDIVLGYNSEN